MKVCQRCGTAAEPDEVTRGSIWIEVILWLCFLVPGLIYSFWRLSTRQDACAKCGSTDLVPIDSPVGRQLVASYGHQQHAETRPPSKAARGIGRSLGRAVRYIIGR